MAFTLPELPYSRDALEPHISAETLEYHYGKHHAGYVKKLNAALESDPSLQGQSLEQLILNTKGGVFNNAAQVWNHTFYWHCLSPDGGGKPGGRIAEAIDAAFGDFDTFKQKFSDAANGQFGSGWAWLTRDADGKLHITSTSDAKNPMTEGHTPILTCDVWEHAYYIDRRNDRANYVEHFWALVNWKFVEQNLGQRGA